MSIELAKKLVNAIPVTAVIAGGYFRDLDLGRSPRDIDVFIQGDWEEAFRAKAIAERYGYFCEFTTYETSQPGTINFVLRVTKTGELPIDVILLNIDPILYVSRFSVSSSKVYWFEGDIIRHEDYKAFLDYNIIINYGTTVKYLEKLTKYFPTATIISNN